MDDDEGGLEAPQPVSLREKQLDFVLHWLSERDDERALRQLNYDLPDDEQVSFEDLAAWREDPEFAKLVVVVSHDPQVAFKELGSLMFIQALLALRRSLKAKSGWERIKALELWARSQGLLIDRVKREDESLTRELARQLLERMPVRVIEVVKERPALPARSRDEDDDDDY